MGLMFKIDDLQFDVQINQKKIIIMHILKSHPLE